MLLPLLLLCAGCADTSGPVSANDVEALLQESQQQQLARENEIDHAIRLCMTKNGFDDVALTREVETIDLAPDLEGIDQIESIGSGIVAYELWRLDNGFDPTQASTHSATASDGPTAESEDEARWEALYESVRVDGETVQGGCSRWAEEKYQSDHPEYVLRLETYDAYGAYMEPAYEDVRIKELDGEWVDCMAAEGFGGFHHLGEHFDEITRRVESIHQGSEDLAQIRLRLEELLAFDRAVSVAATDCSADISQRRDEIFAEYARQFADEYAEDLELSGAGG
jgi:hypothetical protein